MSLATVALRAPLVLIPGFSLDDQLRKKGETCAGLPPSVGRVAHDLNQLHSGAAVLLDPGRANYSPSLLVHTRTYRLRLEPTKRGTGYLVKSIDPLRLSDHARLSRSCLLVRPPSWQMVPELRAVPDGSDAQWQDIETAWERLGTAYAEKHEVPSISEVQAEFLGTVDRLIDATEEITTREQRNAAPFPYRAISSTGGKRNTPRAMYEFQLVGRDLPPPGSFVRIQGEEETRGQVNRAEGRSVTVRFDQPVSWEKLPRQGALEITPSTVVFQKQRQAVAGFRSRDTKNSGLLPALVEHQVRHIPATPMLPRQELDPEQLAAFRRALTTEDLLVVLGPPGTGKTRTITEIAYTCATAGALGGGRTLVTSHTNRAVDNVLARLPEDLVVIRVGVEDKVHEDVKPLLLEWQTESLSQEIHHTATMREQAYRDAEAAQPWTVELAVRLDQVDALVQDEKTAALRLDASIQAVGAPHRERLTELRRQQADQEAVKERLDQRSAEVQAKLRSARERSDAWLTGWFHRSMARRRERQLGEVRDGARQAGALLTDLQTGIEGVRTDLDRAVREDPTVRTARDTREKVAQTLQAGIQEAYAAADMAVAALSAVVPGQPQPARRGDPAEVAAGLHDVHGRLERWLPLIAERRKLAEQWHAAVVQDPGQLVPELVRYAQVVGATCIGAASRAELSGVDFDLGIIDEAGQIGVADALVPLSRVRRGVLVGDDRQLPPFLDSEVEDWGEGIGDPALLRLMSQSALERLRSGLPASHVVQLTRQRRMPAEIADFISSAFYQGRLLTEKEHRHTDPLFASPMAFVDTAAQPDRARYESGGRLAENRYGRKGFFNTCEARLLARLAAFYHRRGSEWVVIVPYLAQRAAVIRELIPLIGDSQLANASVGSVDSYQGGECEVVLYGFTRSNPRGQIGFLKELRRANVAFSRAQRQLVMTGDLSTLLRADDPDFRKMADDLHRHLNSRGDLRTYQDVMHRLRAAAPDPEGDGT
ncbi:DEAD/DEAH box helicase [Streptomyces ureilyticus]|uniref:AAA family ATPase n=1 Tax=Streptomyces ureilyticus TaxID=1775131 RepID=A0ABX0DXN2_9ACTN|nr:AAA domain-containing protein [Streptomyces ureilyticus]NGO46691.1 AAA family ATPase [Streptomyces ureilyticus]